jgi:hypothetical protein
VGEIATPALVRLFPTEQSGGVLRRAMGMQDRTDLADFDGDFAPTSQVRPVDSRARRLLVDTGLRGEAAEAAWITVTDESGAVVYDGALGADGCVDVSFEPRISRACIQLETPRCHRRAEVALTGGWTAHVFKT